MQSQLLASLFSATVVTVAERIDAVEGDLYPEEEALMKNAASKRRMEFTAGRACARAALAALGIDAVPLLAAPDRTPLWPPGVLGSISHGAGYCGVAVAWRRQVAAIGLDIDSATGLDAELWPVILTDSEMSWLHTHPASSRAVLAKLIFSAKECTYKCQHSVYRLWMDFHDLAVEADLDAGTFVASFIGEHPIRRAGSGTVRGRFACGEGLVATGMQWDVPPGARPA